VLHCVEMGDAEQPAGDARSVAADVQAVIDFSRQFMDLRLSHLSNASSILERSFKVNDSAAAFYEKVILFDGATIGLSLSFLASFVAHTSSSHVPRHPFLWFLCPAWVLLLVSIYCCSMRVAGYHNINNSLLRHFSALSSQYYYQHFGIITNRLSTQLKAGLNVKGKDLREVFSDVAASWMTTAELEGKQISDLLAETETADKKSGYLARAGVMATTIALVLFCIFAVKTILSV
jgi:hypothetical protein